MRAAVPPQVIYFGTGGLSGENTAGMVAVLVQDNTKQHPPSACMNSPLLPCFYCGFQLRSRFVSTFQQTNNQKYSSTARRQTFCFLMVRFQRIPTANFKCNYVVEAVFEDTSTKPRPRAVNSSLLPVRWLQSTRWETLNNTPA